MIRRIMKFLLEILILLLSFVILYPFLTIVVNSFKTKAEAAEMSIKLPKVWHGVENYKELFDTVDIMRAFINSIIITVIVVTVVVCVGSMTAFILQRNKKVFSGVTYNIFMLGLIIPISITPTYFLVQKMGLNRSILGATVVYISTSLALSIFLYTSYFKSIPKDLDESAIVDGCGTFRLFYSIIFPLVKPITITVIILTAIRVWNDFQIAIYFLGTPKKMTIVLSTYFFHGQKASDWNLVFADIVAITAPIVIMFLALQKHFISGITSGAVKG